MKEAEKSDDFGVGFMVPDEDLDFDPKLKDPSGIKFDKVKRRIIIGVSSAKLVKRKDGTYDHPIVKQSYPSPKIRGTIGSWRLAATPATNRACQEYSSRDFLVSPGSGDDKAKK